VKSDPRVLLVFPSFDYEEQYGGLAKAASSMVPVSLIYLGTYLKQKGVPVRIFDGQVMEQTEAAVRLQIEEFAPTMVGITTYTPMAPDAHKIASVIKKIDPSLPVVMGGTHPSVLAREVMADPNVDYVVRGEGEETVFELVEALSTEDGEKNLDKVLGLTYRKGAELVSNPARALEVDLDKLPIPDWSMLPLDRYHQLPESTFRTPVRAILTSRGCPYKCVYCSSRYTSGYKYRYRSADNVCDELDILINQYGARQILFLDDNFVVNKKRTHELMDEMIRRGFHRKILWTCAGRVDQVDQPLLEKMKAAGCKLMSFGIETGSQRLLDLLKKGAKVEQARKAVELARKAGLKTRGTMMLGIPTETREESLATIKFAKDIGLNFAKFSLTTPYPGTEIYNYAKENNLIEGEDWKRFSSQAGYANFDPIFVPEGRTAEELKTLQRRAMREFYFRPRQVLDMLKNMSSVADIGLYFTVAKSLVFGTQKLED